MGGRLAHFDRVSTTFDYFWLLLATFDHAWPRFGKLGNFVIVPLRSLGTPSQEIPFFLLHPQVVWN